MWSTYQLQVAKKNLETKAAEAKKDLELEEYIVKIRLGLSAKDWIPFSFELDDEIRETAWYKSYQEARHTWWTLSGRLKALEKQLTWCQPH